MLNSTFAVIIRGSAPNADAVRDAHREVDEALRKAGCEIDQSRVELAEHHDLVVERRAAAEAAAKAKAEADAKAADAAAKKLDELQLTTG